MAMSRYLWQFRDVYGNFEMFILQTLVSSMDCIIELEVVRAIFN